MAKSYRRTALGESVEIRYFTTSLTDVNLATKAIRSHWSIENNLHWVLGRIFDEDFYRVRKDDSVQNMNLIRKIVMNLLKSLDFSGLFPTKKKNLMIGNKQTLCMKSKKSLLNAIQNARTCGLLTSFCKPKFAPAATFCAYKKTQYKLLDILSKRLYNSTASVDWWLSPELYRLCLNK